MVRQRFSILYGVGGEITCHLISISFAWVCYNICVCVKKGTEDKFLARKQPLGAVWCRPGSSPLAVNLIGLAICSMVQFWH